MNQGMNRAFVLGLLLSLGALAQTDTSGTSSTGTSSAGTSMAAPSLQPSDSFTLSGALTPATFTLADIQAMPPTTLNLTYSAAGKAQTHLFTGVLLSTLLMNAGPQFGSAKNASLNYYVVARGSDGYSALFSWGELDPAFGNRQVLIAYLQDGKPLGNEGALRLVVPGDGKGGRFVSALTGITLARAAGQ